MTDNTTLHTLETQLTQHYISIDVLLGFFALSTLDRSRPDWRTMLDEQLCACIQLLGGVREPDLLKITGVDQSTINRRVRALHAAGTIRVTSYATGTVGKPAKWLQMPESTDLDATERAERLAIAQHIIAYRTAWLATQTPPVAPNPAPEPGTEDQPLITMDEMDKSATAADSFAATSPTPAAKQTSAELTPPAQATPPPVQPTLPPQPTQPAIKAIPSSYPISPIALATDTQALPPLWYRSFYLWMTPLIALGLFSYSMNEWAAIVTFTTQVGIPMLWLSGAIMLIALLVQYRETIFASFHPVEHRILIVSSILIIAVAVVQSGLWDLARARWSGETYPVTPQPAPIVIAPTPLALPESTILRPTASCTHGGTARITAPRGLRLRAYADTTAPVLTTLAQNTLVTVLCTEPITAESIRWVQIQYGEQHGWVAATANGTPYLTHP
jgi:hypothetical protein